MEDLEDLEKEEAKKMFIEGFKFGRNVEEVSDAGIRAAESEFERRWQR